MLTKKKLGAAIRRALELKKGQTGLSFAEIARTKFKVAPESVHGWMATGAISKPHFEELRIYVSDVVGRAHWGNIHSTEDRDSESEIERVGAGGSVAQVLRHRRKVVQDLCDLADRISELGVAELIGQAKQLAKTHPLVIKQKRGRAKSSA